MQLRTCFVFGAKKREEIQLPREVTLNDTNRLAAKLGFGTYFDLITTRRSSSPLKEKKKEDSLEILKRLRNNTKTQTEMASLNK